LVLVLPLRGAKLAYYLKKRDPELYEKARKVKELYNLTWDAAIAIARGEAPPPAPSKVEELARALEELKADFEAKVKSDRDFLKELGECLNKLEARVKELEGVLYELRIGLSRRFKDNYLCVHVDREGYCTEWFYYGRIEGFVMKEDTVKGRKVYKINVLKHKLVCALCPSYRPRGREAQPKTA